MRAPLRSILAVLLAVVAVLAFAACGDDDDRAAAVEGEPVATQTVKLPRSYKFDPAVIKVRAGSTVTWQNEDDFPHNVKVLELDRTEDLPVGGTATIEFPDAGTFLYQCTFHPDQMRGRIVVEA
jgi:plastocyanin